MLFSSQIFLFHILYIWHAIFPIFIQEVPNLNVIILCLTFTLLMYWFHVRCLNKTIWYKLTLILSSFSDTQNQCDHCFTLKDLQTLCWHVQQRQHLSFFQTKSLNITIRNLFDMGICVSTCCLALNIMTCQHVLSLNKCNFCRCYSSCWQRS